jgi:AraC-like DNA-binding protein
MLPFRLRPHSSTCSNVLVATLPRQTSVWVPTCRCARYRTSTTRLGTPKKLVVVAKMLRAYHHFKNSDLLFAQVSTLVGFSRVRAFVDHATHIFGCRPSNLRAEPDSQEIVRALLDWLYKPFS